MAFNFRYTRYSAICHLFFGGLCVVFGIADRATMYKRDALHQSEELIAMGAWGFITGIIGCFATQRIPNSESPKAALIGTYMAFSIVGMVFAAMMTVSYTIVIIAIIQNPCYEHSRPVSEAGKCRTSIGLGAMIIIFAAVEFGVSIWASNCCGKNYNNGCCCYTSPPPMHQGQVVCLQTQGGPIAAYVMTQGPNGMLMAVPAMAGGPVYPVPTSVGGQVYMMQNPQATTPTQQVLGFPTSVAQQPVVTAQHAPLALKCNHAASMSD